MLGFLQSLKGQVRASNSVAMVTFPASLLSPNFSVRWQHMADVLLAIEAVPGDGSDL
jgi:elongator complex protein 4